MKNSICLLLCIFLVVSLISCTKKNGEESTDAILNSDRHHSDTQNTDLIGGSESDSSTETKYYPPIEERDYSIEYIDGKYYFVFEQPERYIGQQSGMASVWRENWKDLRYDVLYGELSIGEKKVIAQQYSAADNSIECPDFYNFYGPVVPEDLTVDGDMIINRGEYGMLVKNNSGLTFYFMVSTKSEYDRQYENYHKNLDPQETMESYSLKDENKIIEVSKKYRNGKLTNIYFFGTQNGRYFYALIPMYNVTDSLSDEWLFSFGLELYASEND